ncbi:MAG: formylglycine-generating enzyme family protein [Candidatus Methylumidiphilus sp.]
MASCATCGKNLGWAVAHCPFCGQAQPLIAKPGPAAALEIDWLAKLLQDRSELARQWAAHHLTQHYGLDPEQAGRLVHAAVGETKPGAAAQPKPAPPIAALAPAPPAPVAPLPLPSLPDIHGAQPDHVQALQRQAAAALGLAVEFRDALAAGGAGPTMVVLPAGRFLAGSPASEPQRRDNEERPHPVTFERPFAIGKYAVAFEEYDAYAKATGKPLPADEGWGRGRRPVINVAWQDAQDYCAWLSQQTGQVYRLPTEAEWEYACRAGSAGPFSWGVGITPAQANYNGQYAYNGGPTGDYRRQTVAVEAFQPNAFGLHQMHGNVFEWCQDLCPDNCRLIPASPSNPTLPRIFRGGAYNFDPERLRSAARAGVFANIGSDILGFRLARDISKHPIG